MKNSLEQGGGGGHIFFKHRGVGGQNSVFIKTNVQPPPPTSHYYCIFSF